MQGCWGKKKNARNFPVSSADREKEERRRGESQEGLQGGQSQGGGNFLKNIFLKIT